LEDERDYIIKHVVHTIQEQLDGVRVTPIDLRWGITDKQACEGRVVDLCLRYLYESRPFIIGVLGDRYGSSFNVDEVRLSPLVTSVYPDALKEIANGLSITELEIMNGALKYSRDDVNAFFLVKESSGPYPGESKSQFERLEALKQRVLSQQKYPVVRYRNLSDIDQLIKPLEDAIRKRFGIPKQIQKAKLFSIDHPGLEIMGNMNKRHDQYKSICPASLSMLNELDDVIEKGDPCSIFEGPPGIGKSTMLAHLERKHSRTKRHFLFIYGDEQTLPLSDKQFFDFLFVSAKRVLQPDNPGEFEDDACVISAISRNKWCFVIDNTDTDFCYHDIPFHHLPCIIKSVAQWMNKEFGAKLDYKILYVQNTGAENGLPNSYNMPRFHMWSNEGFVPKKVLADYFSVYFKYLDPRILEDIISSPAASNPSSLMLIGDFFRENVKHEELPLFARRVSQLETYEEIITLYLEEMLKECNKNDVTKIVKLLIIFKSGLSRMELQELSQVAPLSFNICLTYLDKFLANQYDGRLHFKNSFAENILCKAFALTELRFGLFEKLRYYNYFWDKIKSLNQTQEAFCIESNKNFWVMYRYWIHIIPDWVFLRFPQNNQLPFDDKSVKVMRWLSLCGGMSYENTSKAFIQFQASQVSARFEFAYHIHSQNKSGKITQEEEKKKMDGLNRPFPQNPSKNDVLHIFELALATKWIDVLKNLAVNPVYVNRILNTGTLIGAWKWLSRQDVPLCDESIRKNTLFPASAFRNIALFLGDTKAVEYYTNDKSCSLYTITLPELPVLQRYLRLFSVWNDDFNLQQPHQITKYNNGRWIGDVDFFGKANGYGIYIWDDFNIYVGEFKHGQKHGKGCYYYNNNNRYDGEWKKDVKEGHGVLTYIDGGKYVGDFKNHMEDGKGRYYFKSGEVYDGQFREGRINGYGRMSFLDGSYFKGTFRDGLYHGKGSYHWPNGEWVTGEWSNGQLLPGSLKTMNA